ncbi:MAG TPA: VOC family protein [Phycisphaerae bacterium]|jgi:hypothetical protein
MTIQWDSTASDLLALKKVTPPLMSVKAMVAVSVVRLSSGDVPRGILRQFYEGVVGMRVVKSDEQEECEVARFVYQRRVVILRGGAIGEQGRLGFLVKDFSGTLMKLRDRSVPYEVLHTDAGMTRCAILRDPAGNWVHLIETRPF